MTTLKTLERQMMNRAASSNRSISSDMMVSHIVNDIRDQLRAEFEDAMETSREVMNAAKAEVAEMKKRMASVELAEIKINSAQNQVGLVQQEAQKRVDEANQRAKEIDSMHNTIHEKHTSTIKEQAQLIAQLQKQVSNLKDEYKDECTKRARAEAAYEAVKGVKEYMKSMLEKVKPMGGSVQTTRSAPTVDFEIIRDGNGHMARIVAKPR